MRVYVDVTETLINRTRTGIQRVVIESARTMVGWPDCTLVRFDFSSGEYRPLTPEEQAFLFGPEPTNKPFFSGRLAFAFDVFRALVVHPLRRLGGAQARREAAVGLGSGWFFTAEVVGHFSRVKKLKAWARRPDFHLCIVVHDLIPWSHPELSLMRPLKFRLYLSVLAHAQVLCAVSDTTRGEWQTWQSHRRLKNPPRAVTVYPGAERVPPLTAEQPSGLPTFACVGTIEVRKNQHRLLEVLETLWQEGATFAFTFAGTASKSSDAFARRLAELRALGRPVRWLNPATETELETLYRQATATVYVSVWEGFGLPVVESLARGTPCIASDRGSVGEVARTWGGCLLVDPEAPETWKRALRSLLEAPALRDELAAAIRRDRFRTWQDFSRDVRREMEAAERPAAP